jgi:redox-sensitive bicupin YhaK (pirin superfamily)
MIAVLRREQTRAMQFGSFRVRRMQPELIDPGRGASAFARMAIVAHAELGTGTLGPMHEHAHVDILSYMWRGAMHHVDSAGERARLSPTNIMLMEAGNGFWHEESTPEGPVEMLQIFLRPETYGEPGRVSFGARPDLREPGRWHLVAGPAGSGGAVTLAQPLALYDIQLPAGAEVALPEREGMHQWLYVMDGEVDLGSERLSKGDAAADLSGRLPSVRARVDTSLALFLAAPQLAA